MIEHKDYDMQAFVEGIRARIREDGTGHELASNPHTPGTLAHLCWQEGHSYDDTHPLPPK